MPRELWSDPYAAQAVDLLQQPAKARAAALQQIASEQAHAVEVGGNAQANAAIAGGQAWSGAANQIGQIPQQIATARENSLKMQLGQQQLASGSFDLAEKQKNAAEADTMNRIYQGAYGQSPSQQPGFQGPTQPGEAAAGAQPPKMTKNADGVFTPDRGWLTQQMASAGLGSHIPSMIESLTKADAATAALQKTKGEIAVQTRDALGSLGATIDTAMKAGVDPSVAFHQAVLHGVLNDVITPQQVQPYLDAVEKDPTKIAEIVKGLRSGSPKQTELDTNAMTAASRAAQAQTGADRLTLETPKIKAETAKAVAEVEGTLPMTAAQKASNDIALQRLGVEKGRLAVEQQNANSAPTLTPEATDMTAKQFAMTGQLPPMGIGKAGASVRATIINRAADMYKNLDLPSQVAAYKANQASLTNVAKTLDTLSAFESTAGKNLDMFQTAMEKVPDTGSPLLNSPLRSLSQAALGDPDVAAAHAAGMVALREIARVTNDPKLSGSLTDSARNEVANLINDKSATLAQVASVAKVLRQDMANVHTSLSEQKDAISQRIATPPGGNASGPAPVVWERGPDGKPRKVGG